MKDELKKMGLRIRSRVVQPAEKPGGAAFDDFGDPVDEGSNDAGERTRRRVISHPALTIVEDEPQANPPIRNNTKGLRLGYNPYESGLLSRKDVRKKRDLRELSKWIEAKKKLAKREQDE